MRGEPRPGASEASAWSDLREALPAWVAARVLVGLAALLASGIARRDTPSGTTLWLGEGLLAWDGQWYERIAVEGYAGMEASLGTDEGLRFFPGHPLLARAVGALPGFDEAIGLVVVANLSALVVAILARRITLAEGHGEAAARRAVWFTSIAPPAFVLVWGYSEALFLVVSMGAMLAARHRWWWVAAACGVVAGATRPLGLLLAIPLAWEAWEAWRGVQGLAAGGASRWSHLWARAAAAPRPGSIAAVASPIAGTATYLWWVGRNFGDPLLPFTVQSPLRGEGVDPLTRMLRAVGDLLGPERFGDGLHLPFAVLFVVLGVLTFRHWPRSYALFGVVFLLTILSTENLNSLERYGLTAFPVVLTLAVVARGWWAERVVLAASAGGLVAMCALAWLGVYVP